MSFDLQPTLTGDLLSLRPLRADHFEALYEVASDPLVWEQHPSSDRYQRKVFEKFFKDAINSGGAFAVVELQSGRIIGSSRYYGFDANKLEVVVGYTFLSRKYWGGTFNREMKRLMLQHASRYVRTVLFHVGDKNIRSQKALEKIGAVRSGSFATADDNGRERTSLVYEITALRPKAS